MTREVWVEFGSNLYLCDWQNGGDAVNTMWATPPSFNEKV
jgi:hypothetical protein